jgi:hypothetical protein
VAENECYSLNGRSLDTMILILRRSPFATTREATMREATKRPEATKNQQIFQSTGR